jgi:hypothetical protein
MPMHEEAVVVEVGAVQAQLAASNALRQSGIGLRNVEQDGNLLVATITPSLRSFGETVTVRVEPQGPAVSRVVVRSESAAALFDWGKNGENVSRITRSLRELVPTR